MGTPQRCSSAFLAHRTFVLAAAAVLRPGHLRVPEARVGDEVAVLTAFEGQEEPDVLGWYRAVAGTPAESQGGAGEGQGA